MIEAAKFRQAICKNYKTDIETYFDNCIQGAVQNSQYVVLLPIVRANWPEDQVKEVLQMYVEKGGWVDITSTHAYSDVYGVLKPR